MLFFAITVLIILSYTALFCFVGIYIKYRWNLHTVFFSHYLAKLGTAFFIGYTFFISSWMILSSFINNVKVALLAITFLAICLTATVFIHNKSQILQNFKMILLPISLISVLIILGLIKAILPMPVTYAENPDNVSPFGGFGGVVHSFRAGNLTNYIVDNNYFPKVNQHSGQSIVASIPTLITGASPQLPLVLWLNIFIGFFILLIYGFIRKFILNSFLALIPTIIVMLGNTVLSPFYASITDTESALFLVSNIDSIFGISSFFILIIYFYDYLKSTHLNYNFLILLSVSGFFWNITSGQMNILFCLLLVFAIFSVKNLNINKNKIYIALICFIIATITGAVTLGGMLMPSKYTDNIKIPGMMVIKQAHSQLVTLRTPRTSENSTYNFNSDSTFEEAKTDTAFASTDKNPTFIDSLKKNQFIFFVSKIGRSVQLVFFPLLGLLLIYKLLSTNKSLLLNDQFLKYLYTNTVLLFLVGWVTSSIFNVYGYTWELSKFLYVGSFLTMLLLGLSLVIYYKKQKIGKMSLILLTLFIITGPSINYISNLSNNIVNDFKSQGMLSFSDRFELLTINKSTFGANR